MGNILLICLGKLMETFQQKQYYCCNWQRLETIIRNYFKVPSWKLLRAVYDIGKNGLYIQDVSFNMNDTDIIRLEKEIEEYGVGEGMILAD